MLIKHKNFMAKINYISRTGCFYGEVINCNDLIIFQTYKEIMPCEDKGHFALGGNMPRANLGLFFPQFH